MKDMTDKDPQKKKKGLMPLKEKMGLDKTTEYHSPRPVPGMAAADLNERENSTMGERVMSRIEEKKGVPNGRPNSR